MPSSSTKKFLSSRSSTEEELIVVDDKMSKVVWYQRLAEAQVFKVNLRFFSRQFEHDQIGTTWKIELGRYDSSF